MFVLVLVLVLFCFLIWSLCLRSLLVCSGGFVWLIVVCVCVFCDCFLAGLHVLASVVRCRGGCGAWSRNIFLAF